MKNNSSKNYKKILCKNFLQNGKCIYENKCLYAHNYNEQIISSTRKIAYDIIMDKHKDLTNINLWEMKHLYNNLNILSNICQECNINKCTGGYNCKHGAINNKMVVCLADLNKGTCDRSCGKIHLTDRGLKPYLNSMAFFGLYNKKNNRILINDNYFNSNKKSEISENSENSDISENSENMSIISDISSIKSNDININFILSKEIDNDKIDKTNVSIFGFL